MAEVHAFAAVVIHRITGNLKRKVYLISDDRLTGNIPTINHQIVTQLTTWS